MYSEGKKKYPIDVQSHNLAIVCDTNGLGTHNKGYVFGMTNTVNTNGELMPVKEIVVAAPTDITKAWTVPVTVPNGFKFTALLTASTSTSALTVLPTAVIGEDNNAVITVVANAEDSGGVISAGEDVTFTWRATDYTTNHATIFWVKCQSDDSAHYATVKARFTEDGTEHTWRVYAGDTISGPFATLEVDALSASDATAILLYQEH
tara:strand:- start:6362 stop:6979 length:618 start_codon:yes stop_codon:yes gene_type:complete